MNIEAYIIDTFTSAKFKGNPTAVCVLPGSIDEKLVRSIAFELNFPVTAFCVAHKADEIKDIRYFTSTGEIPACGHATLATYIMKSSDNERISSGSFFVAMPGKSIRLAVRQKAGRAVFLHILSMENL